MLSFGPNHYVPVLKVKQGEKHAMQQLAPEVAARVTPLLEIVERKKKRKGNRDVLPTIDEHLNTSFKKLDAAVDRFKRYLLDCREMVADGPEAAAKTFARAKEIDVPFTPVTSLQRTVDVASALAYRDNGIALRLSKGEFERGVILDLVPKFLEEHRLYPEQVDIIVDLEAVDNMILEGVEALARGFLEDIPMSARWRTFSLSGCAFPSSLASVDSNSQRTADRLVWQFWKDRLYAKRAELARLPTFSDCGIQHRDGVEDFDFRTMDAPAAIRFADGDSWLLVKGEGIKKAKGGPQFRALATKVIVATSANASHCKGCAGLHAAASGEPKFGSLGKWRELGTIHHITHTVESLAALPWP